MPPVLTKLQGLPCWYVSCGKNTGSSFQLALGKKIPRDKKLDNKFHPGVFRENEPEFGLLVWCSWRLSKNGKLVATSDDCDNNPKWCASLRTLAGSKIRRARANVPFYDLDILFNDGRRLEAFCDRGQREPSIDANWELFGRGRPLTF